MYGLYAGIHICKTIQQQQRVNLILTCDGVNNSMKKEGAKTYYYYYIYIHRHILYMCNELIICLYLVSTTLYLDRYY